MSNETVTIDVEAEKISEPMDQKITPMLQIGLSEDGKTLSCRQLSDLPFNAYMINGMCQLIIDFFAKSVPDEKKSNFELTVLDLILQTKNYKQEEKQEKSCIIT